MKKDVDYYMNLPYTYIAKHIRQLEGGGFTAYIKEFGEHTVVGDGDTASEAIKNLVKNFKEWLEEHIGLGDDIPLPNTKEIHMQKIEEMIPDVVSFIEAESKRLLSCGGIDMEKYSIDEYALAKVVLVVALHNCSSEYYPPDDSLIEEVENLKNF